MNGVVLSRCLYLSISLPLYEVRRLSCISLFLPPIILSLGLLHVEHMPIERVAPRKAGTDGVTLPVNVRTIENGNQS